MRGLINKVDAASKAIREYRDALLLVADVCADSIELPESAFTSTELSEDSLSLLLASLHWVKKLTGAWQSPNATALLKSKGALFLLVYVWFRTASAEIVRNRRAPRKSGTRRTNTRLSRAAAQAVADIVNLCHGVEHTADALNDKLQDFTISEPEIFQTLLSLSRAIDAAATAPLAR